jgi:hypothetical protein
VGKGDLEEQFRCVDTVRALLARRKGLCKIWGPVLLSIFFMLISCFGYSSALKMNVICSSEASVNFQRTAGQWVLLVMLPSACSFIVLSMSYTSCFGLRGRTEQNRKTQLKRAECNHVQEKAKYQPSRFLQEYFFSVFKLFISNQNYIRFYKLICCDSIWHEEISYTLEDGHVGRNM